MLAVALVLVWVPVIASAQPSEGLTLHVGIMEETIVTGARGGERDVQTIPMAVSAVSSAELERLNTTTIYEAAALAPSVTLSQNTNFWQLTIRGVGTNLVDAGSRSPTASG